MADVNVISLDGLRRIMENGDEEKEKELERKREAEKRASVFWGINLTFTTA